MADPLKRPVVRKVDDHFIELDVQKDRHPFLHLERGTDSETGKTRWILIVDSNEGGQIIGESQGIALIFLKNARLRALRDFLNESDLGDKW